MKKEYKIVLLITLIVLFVSNLPIFYFNVFPKPELVFLNRSPLNTGDVYQDISFIEQSKQGRVLFENLYTTESQSPSIIRPSYLFIGKFAAFFNISSTFAYHFFRLIFGIFFCSVLYKFLFYFFTSRQNRIFAFILILISSGLISFFNNLVIPESNTFLSLSEAPHFILSQALMISAFYFLLKYTKKRKQAYLLYAFLFCFFLSFEHPYNLIVIVLTTLFFLIFVKYPLFKSILISAFFSLGLIVQFFLIRPSPSFIGFLWPGTRSPEPLIYLLNFGLILFFALIGAEILFRTSKKENKLLFIWICVTAFLIYTPTDFQRRFVEGVHIPLAILAAFGILALFPYLEKIFKHFRLKFFNLNLYLITFLVILSTPSIYPLITNFQLINEGSISSYIYHIRASEVDGIKWLKEHSSLKDVILSNFFYGNIIPGFGRKVYLGHPIQTINIDAKIAATNSFLLEQDNQKAVAFLKENKITYIFLGDNDSMLLYGFKPDVKPYLQKVYGKNGVSIYKVK